MAKEKKNLKYVFVAGGVMSGVGKGVTTSAIGKILQARGYNVTAMKIDPYVNVDAGTMNPTEHGEVFVLDDGLETDQDMGNYERFLNRNFSSANYLTTGSIYLSVITKERNLAYRGKCVEVVPHIPLEVIQRIDAAADKDNADIVLIEVGGTVGEYQNVLFLEAIRMLTIQNPGDVAVVLVSFLPYQGSEGELKTKPTQYAVRTLNSAGIQPDFIVARGEVGLDDKRKEKIAINCNVRGENVISAPNVKNIYDVPANFEKEELGAKILKKLGLAAPESDMSAWNSFVRKSHAAKKTVRIALVGKYFGTGNFVLADAYISVIEALKHASINLNIKAELEWINSEEFEGPSAPSALKRLSEFDGVVVPGGFGSRGIEGKISAIEYCRKNKLPFFGLCYGMQLAVVEYARNVVGLSKANSTEVDIKTPYPVIDILEEQKGNIADQRYGGTMRLGSYPALLKKGSVAAKAYRQNEISERHRHRYEVNPDHVNALVDKGLVFSGTSPDNRLMEIAELPADKHPFFLATQFHPEFTSKPLQPHPLFIAFIKALGGNKK